MACPSCRVALVMSERAGVEIDYCPKCRGVWLDRGELDKILERGRAEMAAMSAPAAPGPDPAAMQQGSVWLSQPRQAGWGHEGPPAPQFQPPSHGQKHYGQPHQAQPHYEPQPYRQKRRKSFLEDLFD